VVRDGEGLGQRSQQADNGRRRDPRELTGPNIKTGTLRDLLMDRGFRTYSWLSFQQFAIGFLRIALT
jgi:hypothetical protein